MIFYRILLVLALASCFFQVLLIAFPGPPQAYETSRAPQVLALLVSLLLTWAGYVLGKSQRLVAACVILLILAIPSLFFALLYAAVATHGFR